MTQKLKKIDFTQPTFECDGKTFYIADSVSFARYELLQQEMLHFGFSINFQNLFVGIKDIYEKLNNSKIADASVIANNLIAGVQKLKEKEDPSFRICALFINEQNEDLCDVSEAMIGAKIKSWSKELDPVPFFHFAAALLPEWFAAWKIVTQNILVQNEQETK